MGVRSGGRSPIERVVAPDDVTLNVGAGPGMGFSAILNLPGVRFGRDEIIAAVPPGGTLPNGVAIYGTPRVSADNVALVELYNIGGAVNVSGRWTFWIAFGAKGLPVVSGAPPADLTTVAGYAAYIESLAGVDGATVVQVFQPKVNQTIVGGHTTEFRDHLNRPAGKFVPTTEAPAGPLTDAATGNFLDDAGMQWDNLTDWTDELLGASWCAWARSDSTFAAPLVVGTYAAEGAGGYTHLLQSIAGTDAHYSDYQGYNAVSGGAGPSDNDSIAGGKFILGGIFIHPARVCVTTWTGRMVGYHSRVDLAASRSATQSAIGTGNRRVRICKGNPAVRAWGAGADQFGGAIRGNAPFNNAQWAAINDMGEEFFNQYQDRRDLAGWIGNSFVNRVAVDIAQTLKPSLTSPRGACVNLIGWDGAFPTGSVGNRDFTDPAKDWGIVGMIRYHVRFLDTTKCTVPCYGATELINGSGNLADELFMYDAIRAQLRANVRFFGATVPGQNYTALGAAHSYYARNQDLVAGVGGHAPGGLVRWDLSVLCDAAHNRARYWQLAHPTPGLDAASDGGGPLDCGGQVMATAPADSILTAFNAVQV